MADIRYRCTFFFNYQNRGFSETWWKTASSLTTLATFIDEYVTTRLAFQPPTVSFGGVRVSVDGQSRKGRTLFPGGNDGEAPASSQIVLPTIGTFSLSGTAWDLGQQCIQTEVISGGQRLGFRYIGILPDAVSKTEPQELDINAIPAWKTAWIAWRNQVISNGWQLVTTQASDKRPELPIQGWLIGTGMQADWSIVVVAPGVPAGWAIGANVVVRGARMKFSGLQSPNGRWRISALPAPMQAGTAVAVLQGTAGLSLNFLASQGTVYLYGREFVNASNLSPYSVTKHKRGGPFPHSRGRRSKPRFPPS